MRLLFTYLLLICIGFVNAQVNLDCEGVFTQEGLQLTLLNDGVEGPVRIKLETTFVNVSSDNLQGASISDAKGYSVLIWTDFTAQEKVTIDLKTDIKSKDIGMVSYLEDGERINKKIVNKTEKIDNVVAQSKIPLQYRSLDLNQDGEIKVDELNAAINGFFEEENDLTPQDLKELINFFFDQD